MTVSKHKTPSNTANTDAKLSGANKTYLRHLVDRGYGWEDILVKCRRIPRLREIAPEALRSFVLRKHDAPASRARSEGVKQPETVLRPTRD